jgi:hypothetical protein
VNDDDPFGLEPVTRPETWPEPEPGPLPDGPTLLRDVETFLGRFVVYPSVHAGVAHVLWVAHTWLMHRWESTPRLAFLSPEPGSGKSRALEVTEHLVPRPIHAVNVSPAYLFRKVSDPAGPPTILFDEIDTVFGPKAKDNEDIRGLLNAGHRRGAVAGRAVVKGKVIETEELPAYCAVAVAGLDDLPDTLMTRSVVVRMRRRAPSEVIEPWRARDGSAEARVLAHRLAAWTSSVADRIGEPWPEMPDGVTDRAADVWEALIAVADLAGDEWPDRARVAAVTVVTDAMGDRPSLGVQLLSDLWGIFQEDEVTGLPTVMILERLQGLEESPWGDLRGKPLDARGLARRLSKYGVKPKPIRVGSLVVKGYDAADLHDPWARYLSRSHIGPVTSVTSDTEPESTPFCADVDGHEPIHFTASDGRHCRTCSPLGSSRPLTLITGDER